MKQTVTEHQFREAFRNLRPDNFSYAGLMALWDYLEEYEDSTGEELELDIIGLCCDFTEYETATEAAENYFEFEGMAYDEEGNETETPEEVEEKALSFLQDRTSVIPVKSGGVIIAEF